MRTLALIVLALIACQKDDHRVDGSPGSAGSATGLATGSAGSAAPVPTMTDDELATASVAMFQKIAAAASADGSDCAKLVKDLTPMREQVHNVGVVGKALETDPARNKAFQAKYGKQLDDAGTAARTAIAPCGNDPGIVAFFKSTH